MTSASAQGSVYINPKPIYHHVETATYVLPNDAPEHTRLEIQAHHLSGMVGGKIIHSPIEHPKKVIDVGCGTGIVTELLATKFAKAQVFGLNLSEVPELRKRPANVSFPARQHS